MTDERRPRSHRPLVFPLLGALIAAASPAACGGEGTPASGGATTAAATQSAAPEPVRNTPRGTSGGSASLSPDGQHLFVADEDHDTVFLVPTAFTNPRSVRAVQMPGPPSQIVASENVVWVTVRNLPEDSSKELLGKIRGSYPSADQVRKLASGALYVRDMNGLYLAPSEYQKYLDDAPLDPPAKDPEEDKRAAVMAAAKAAAAGSGSAKPATTTTAAPAPKPKPASKPAGPKGGTPSAPFDSGVARRSQGGLLVAMKPDAERGLVETGRVLLAPDAWGLAVTPDGLRAVVTSAWSAEVSVVDLEKMTVITRFPTAREPRGVVLTKDGKTAYITHLVGTDLTKIEQLDGEPKLSVQPLPTAPGRQSGKTPLGAALGYSAVLSPDGESLFVPRHALGADGHDSWWGAAAVDVMDVRTGKHVVPQRQPGVLAAVTSFGENMWGFHDVPWMAGPDKLPEVNDRFVQPRAVVYRKKTDTLLIAGEGMDTLVELDAIAPDPAMFMRGVTNLAVYNTFGHDAVRGGAPSGLALSNDEDTVYIWCRTTFDVVKLDLKSRKAEWYRLGEDGLPADAAKGRKLFYSARSPQLSGGLGCASCHPDGRDDGYTWREATTSEEDATFVGRRSNVKIIDPDVPPNTGVNATPLYARQTPMIAGRVRSPGPYGWHAEAKNLVERLFRGFRLHRAPWQGAFDADQPWRSADEDMGPFLGKIDAIMDFIQSGLLPPPTLVKPLTDQEKKGKEIFDSKQAQCSACHVPETGFTDRTAYPLRALLNVLDFDKEDNTAFKTPSLYFIAQTAPYFHDGSAPTLEALVKNNGSRMGQTVHLNADDQAALVAYLRTL
jgi:cytochrome c peroxidase